MSDGSLCRCAACGLPLGAAERGFNAAMVAHVEECPKHPMADLRARLAAAERDRDEAHARLNITRETVAEMTADAVRPRGGQSVSPRRMPVPLSVVRELEMLLGPDRGGYAAERYREATAERDTARAALAAAERRAEEAERALREAADLASDVELVMFERTAGVVGLDELQEHLESAVRALRSPGDHTDGGGHA